MAGVLHTEVSLRGALSTLDALRAAGADTRPAFKAMRKPLRSDLRAHAKAQEGPGGAKWPERKPPRRLKGRAGEPRKLARKRSRRVLGKLPNATGLRVERRAIYAISKVKKWSRVHNEGGKAGRGARIPQRQYLWIGDGMKAKAAQILVEHVQKAAR